MKTKIVVGSRGSKLALIQTESVVAKIREANPGIEVNISKIVTKGDRNRHVQLDRVSSIGIFVKELEEALLDGRIDLAVHSLKDIPTEVPAGLDIAAVTERLDPRDVLVSQGKRLNDLAAGKKIGTGSLRRSVQVKSCRPDLEVFGIRGNVETRIDKVTSGEFDGIITAAAALKRLGMEDRICEYLSSERFLPAVGQGVIAIESRLNDGDVTSTIAPINHLPTWQSIIAERSFLSALGGGCRAPIAALGTVNGATLRLEGMVADVKETKILSDSEEGNITAPEELGVRLANKLLARGAGKFLFGAI